MSVDDRYFVDENEGCKEYITNKYTDCNGEEFCITTEEDLPYKQAQEIHAPVFISTTLGSDPFYESRIMVDTDKIKGITYLHLQYPLKVGDIIGVKGTSERYYIFRNMNRDKFGNFLYQIKRVDGFSIVQLDLNSLKKGKIVKVKGYFK